MQRSYFATEIQSNIFSSAETPGPIFFLLACQCMRQQKCKVIPIPTPAVRPAKNLDLKGDSELWFWLSPLNGTRIVLRDLWIHFGPLGQRIEMRLKSSWNHTQINMKLPPSSAGGSWHETGGANCESASEWGHAPPLSRSLDGTSHMQCMYGGLCLKKKAKNPQKQENWPLHFGQKRTKFPEFLQINYPKPNILKCYRS